MAGLSGSRSGQMPGREKLLRVNDELLYQATGETGFKRKGGHATRRLSAELAFTAVLLPPEAKIPAHSLQGMIRISPYRLRAKRSLSDLTRHGAFVQSRTKSLSNAARSISSPNRRIQ